MEAKSRGAACGNLGAAAEVPVAAPADGLQHAVWDWKVLLHKVLCCSQGVILQLKKGQ